MGKQEYSPAQLFELRRGMENGVDVERYNDLAYLPGQMRQIRLGLESKNVNVSFMKAENSVVFRWN